MNNQELLECICGYLPYGLKFYHKRMDDEPTELLTLQSTSLIGGKLDLMFGDGVYEENIIWMSDLITQIHPNRFGSWVKPVLRPLCDFSRQCIGESINPAIYLARMCDNGHNHADSIVKKFGNDHVMVYTDKCDDIETVNFNFRDGRLFSVDMCNEHVTACTIQKILHQLHVWHFDLYGLIKKGHAIDINTLNKKNNDRTNVD